MIKGSEIAVSFYLLMGSGRLIYRKKKSFPRCVPLEETQFCGLLVVFGTKTFQNPVHVQWDAVLAGKRHYLSLIHLFITIIFFFLT